VFHIKCTADSSIEQYKACLVAQGFSQQPHWDFVQSFAPTICLSVVITLSNEGAKPGVCPMLGLLSVVLLQVHIGQAAPHMEVSNIGLVAIPELKGGTAYCTGAGCRCSWTVSDQARE